MKNKVSPEVEISSMKIAKGTQVSGQTKAQTKLIARGIEKGIAEYKKQQAKKSREMDKQRKQQINRQNNQAPEALEVPSSHKSINYLPWVLLVLSWICFAIFTLF